MIDVGDDMYASPVPAGGAVLNGAGECTGFLTAAEWGLAETPVFLTSTMQLGRVYDAACELLMEDNPRIGEDVIIPVVAECDDSFLNDARRMQVTKEDVRAALAAARASAGGGPGQPGQAAPAAPAEGAVGAGTGMSCLGFKGGIGTASRLVPSGHVVGVLVLTNFGGQDRLTVDGIPVGRLLPPAPTSKPNPAPSPAQRPEPPSGGSCIVVTVTDAPLDAAACARLARRAGLGLARTGSTANHGSGEIFLALATGLRGPRGANLAGLSSIAGSALNPFFAAVVEATEEAVLNSMFAAPTVTGRDGNESRGLPAGQVRELLTGAGYPAAPGAR